MAIKPDLEEMESQRQELMLFGQGLVHGEGASATDDPRMPSARAGIGTGPPRMPSAMNAGDWDEAKHPHADDGKFGEGADGESGGSADEVTDVSAWGKAYPE